MIWEQDLEDKRDEDGWSHVMTCKFVLRVPWAFFSGVDEELDRRVERYFSFCKNTFSMKQNMPVPLPFSSSFASLGIYMVQSSRKELKIKEKSIHTCVACRHYVNRPRTSAAHDRRKTTTH